MGKIFVFCFAIFTSCYTMQVQEIERAWKNDNPEIAHIKIGEDKIKGFKDIGYMAYFNYDVYNYDKNHKDFGLYASTTFNIYKRIFEKQKPIYMLYLYSYRSGWAFYTTIYFIIDGKRKVVNVPYGNRERNTVYGDKISEGLYYQIDKNFIKTLMAAKSITIQMSGEHHDETFEFKKNHIDVLKEFYKKI